jgi:translation initiation factor IF-2
MDHLLEMILLVADLKELKASPDSKATGVVLETRLDRTRGILATVLVQNGTLRSGDSFIAGMSYGKVRRMVDEHGKKVSFAGPSTPVEVMGFAAEPSSGDRFQAIADDAKARQIASFRREKQRAAKAAASPRASLEQLSQEIAQGGAKELRVLLKGDVNGSLEAIQKALSELPSDKIQANVLRSSIGAITQADVVLASASNALIIGFNVRPDRATAEQAKQEGVEVRLYTVIYDLLDDVKQAMLGMLEPILRESVQGQAQVRQPFKIPRDRWQGDAQCGGAPAA